MFTFLFTSAYSQIDLKINPLGVLFSSPDLAAEYVINENFGVELSVGLEYGNVAGTGLLGDEFELSKSGYKIRLSGRYYFRPVNGADRFYAGLYTGPRSNTVTGNSDLLGYDPGYKRSAFTAGILVGYKWVADNGLIFELGVGGGRAFASKIELNDSENTTEVNGFGGDFVGTLAVGYRLGGGGGSSSSKSKRR